MATERIICLGAPVGPSGASGTAVCVCAEERGAGNGSALCPENLLAVASPLSFTHKVGLWWALVSSDQRDSVYYHRLCRSAALSYIVCLAQPWAGTRGLAETAKQASISFSALSHKLDLEGLKSEPRGPVPHVHCMPRPNFSVLVWSGQGGVSKLTLLSLPPTSLLQASHA